MRSIYWGKFAQGPIQILPTWDTTFIPGNEWFRQTCKFANMDPTFILKTLNLHFRLTLESSISFWLTKSGPPSCSRNLLLGAIVTPLSEILIPHLWCHFLGPHPAQEFVLYPGCNRDMTDKSWEFLLLLYHSLYGVLISAVKIYFAYIRGMVT